MTHEYEGFQIILQIEEAPKLVFSIESSSEEMFYWLDASSINEEPQEIEANAVYEVDLVEGQFLISKGKFEDNIKLFKLEW